MSLGHGDPNEEESGGSEALKTPISTSWPLTTSSVTWLQPVVPAAGSS